MRSTLWCRANLRNLLSNVKKKIFQCLAYLITSKDPKKLRNQEINHLGTYESRNGLPPLKFCTKPLPNPAAPIELRFSPSAGRAAQELWSTAGECKAGQKVGGDWHQKHMCVSLDHLIFTSGTPHKHVFVPPVEIQRNWKIKHPFI